MKAKILFAAFALASIAATPAAAIPRTFVSSTGGGAACTRGAPCAAFQAAHDATDPNGEINCVDDGEYGVVAITKSITIDCTGTSASITTTSNAITINAPGGTVRLRNLTLLGSPLGGLRAILFSDGIALFVERCTIASIGIGVQMAAQSTRMHVTDSVIEATSMAVVTGGFERVVLDRVTLQGNQTGLLAQSSASIHVRDSVLTGGHTGVDYQSNSNTGQGVGAVVVDQTSVTLADPGNNGPGVRVQGDVAFVILGRSTVVANGIGLQTFDRGAIFSYRNNHLTGNAVDGEPTAFLTLK